MEKDGQQICGRSTELSRLRMFLDLLPAAGGGLVLHGEPGIGRSTLLDWTAGEAASRGILVVATRAVEDECASSYAGLHRLAHRLPQVVGKLLTDAITDGQPLAKVAFGLLEGVAAVAKEQPVLLVVDDGQWLDPTSWKALAFVARRLTDKPALALVGMRAGGVTSTRLAGSGIAELALEPLDIASAHELVGQRAPGLPADVVDQLTSLARGNPLGLVELGAVAEAGVPAAELPLTRRLERGFAQVADSLPWPTRTLVQIAALDDELSRDEIVAAARPLLPAASEDDLAPAVTERVLEIVGGSRIAFRHPLMRLAVRQGMDIDRRRQLHRALSSALSDDSSRRLWHRASASVAPDAPLAAELADAAALAQRRGAAGWAAQLYERAADLTKDLPTRGDLLLSAAHTAHETGDPTAVKRLLNRLADGGPPGATQAHDVQLRGSIVVNVRAGSEAGPHLLGVVETLVERGKVDLALQSAVLHAGTLADADYDADYETRQAVVEQVQRLPVADDDPRKLCVLGLLAPLEQCATVLPVVRRQATTLTAGPHELHLLAQAALGIGALPAALRLATAAVPGLRAQHLLGLLGQALSLQAAVASQLGNVTLAETSAAEAREVAATTLHPGRAASAALAGAGAAALRGDGRAAKALISSAEQTLQLNGASSGSAQVQLARGQASAATGSFDTAFDVVRPLFDPNARAYHVQLRFWALPLLAEVAAITGRRTQLHAIVVGLAPQRGTGLPVLEVGLAYADAVLTDSEEGYGEALVLEGLGDWPLELARLQHAYGGWLRRHRRSVEARPLLRSAANTFAVLGATAWAERAEAELRASGERTQRGPHPEQALTAQELQIARLAAEGLSNQMIATRLVRSVRTVDSHLYRTFRKLGVTSRAQLSELLTRTDPGTDRSSPMPPRPGSSSPEEV